MQKSQQNPTLLLNYLNFADFFEQGLRPTMPLLADICSLSIGQVRYALPFLCDAVACQLLAQTKPNQQTSEQTFRLLFSYLQHDIVVACEITDGLNLKKLQQNQASSQKFLYQLFDNQQKFNLIMGVLLQTTQLALLKLEKLLGFMALLSVKLLSNFYQYLSKNKTILSQNFILEKVFSEWLDYQNFALNTAENQVFWQILNYSPKLGIAQSQKRAENLAKSDILRHLTTQIDLLIAQQPLAILSNQAKSSTNSVSNSQPVLQTSENSKPHKPTSDIFAKMPAKKSTWIDLLQKYWIATSISLTTVMIGGIGQLMPDSDKSKTEPSAQPVEKVKPRYQDVAIIKIASTPPATVPASTTQTTKTDRVVKNDAVDKKIIDKKPTDKSTPKLTQNTDKSDKKSEKTLKTNSEPKSQQKTQQKSDNTKKSETNKKVEKSSKSDKKVVKKDEKKSSSTTKKSTETEKTKEAKSKTTAKSETAKSKEK